MGEQRDIAIGTYENITAEEIGRMVEDTPLGVDNAFRYPSQGRQGNVRFNWQSGRTVNSKVLKGSSFKGKDFAQKAISGKLKNGKPVYIFNNHPAINVLEYGGYPTPVKKGTKLRGGGYEKRSANGFSRQAPKGMIRVAIRRIQTKLTRLQRF